MPQNSYKPVTRLLQEATDQNPAAAESLLPRVYDELRMLARSRLRKLPPGQTLQPTALVHEAYLRMVRKADPGWDGKGHFFAAAAQAMRDILVEQARRKKALKHGGDRCRVDSDEVEPVAHIPSDDVLAVDEAVQCLEEEEPRKGRIVNLRYFARLTAKETAQALNISVSTVEREWRYIRAWLECKLRPDP